MIAHHPQACQTGYSLLFLLHDPRPHSVPPLERATLECLARGPEPSAAGRAWWRPSTCPTSWARCWTPRRWWPPCAAAPAARARAWRSTASRLHRTCRSMWPRGASTGAAALAKLMAYPPTKLASKQVHGLRSRSACGCACQHSHSSKVCARTSFCAHVVRSREQCLLWRAPLSPCCLLAGCC